MSKDFNELSYSELILLANLKTSLKEKLWLELEKKSKLTISTDNWNLTQKAYCERIAQIEVEIQELQFYTDYAISLVTTELIIDDNLKFLTHLCGCEDKVWSNGNSENLPCDIGINILGAMDRETAHTPKWYTLSQELYDHYMERKK